MMRYECIMAQAAYFRQTKRDGRCLSKKAGKLAIVGGYGFSQAKTFGRVCTRSEPQPRQIHFPAGVQGTMMV
jgi:hypothetical protein